MACKISSTPVTALRNTNLSLAKANWAVKEVPFIGVEVEDQLFVVGNNAWEGVGSVVVEPNTSELFLSAAQWRFRSHFARFGREGVVKACFKK